MNPSLYIHVPICLKKCDYCDFFSVPVSGFPVSKYGRKDFSFFLQGIHDEISYRRQEFNIRFWDTIYIGGGTPSLLSPSDIRFLFQHPSLQKAGLSNQYTEITIEANPEDITSDWLNACLEVGINRLSMGIQSMNDAGLIGIGRRGSRKSNIAGLELVSSVWKGQLSLDLIAGLPGQTIEKLLFDIQEIIQYKPHHISLYSLTLEESTPLCKSIQKKGYPVLPEEDQAADMWITGRDALESLGYQQYEVSNFALSGCECRHNLSYWNLDSYVGIGPGATGNINFGDTAIRNTNSTDIPLWLTQPTASFTSEHISRKDTILETLLMGMRLKSGISRKRFFDRFSDDILAFIGTTARSWNKRKFLNINDDTLFLSKEGLLLLNRFLSDCMEELC